MGTLLPTTESAKVSWEHASAKKFRIVTAAKRRLRRVSGWNLFLKTELQKRGQLNPTQFAAEQELISNKWKSLPGMEKAEYNLLAEHEQEMRNQCLDTALPTKGSTGSASKSNGLKKLSVKRLQNNFKNAATHPIWSSPSQLGN